MFPALLRVGFASMVAYRAEIVIWILSTTMPLIMYTMWSTVAREAPIGRFDDASFASYCLVMLVVRQLSSAWVVWEVNELVRSGQLSMSLLPPVHPIVYFAAENRAAIPLRLMVMAPIVALALWAIPGIRVSDAPANLLLAVAATFLSWLLTFLFQALIGVLALYTQQSLSFQEAWFGLWALFSGYLMPLELFPALERVARWLPFRSMAGLPTEIALGHLQGAALWQSLSIQLAWVLAVGVLLSRVWPRAIRVLLDHVLVQAPRYHHVRSG